MRANIPLIMVGSLLAATLHLGAWPFTGNEPANAWTNAVEIPSGFSTIANPMNHARGQHVNDAVLDNSVASVLPIVPVGTVLYKFDAGRKEWSENIFRHRGWSNPNETLGPGDGAMIFNPKRHSVRVTFTGNAVFAFSLGLPAGLSFVSYPGINFEPLPPPPDEWGYFIWTFSRRLLPQEGDKVFTFDRAHGRFVPHTFYNGAWDSTPVVSPFESIFVYLPTARTIVDYDYGPS